MVHCFGLHASGKWASFVDLDATVNEQKLRGEKGFQVDKDFWQELDPGPLKVDSSAQQLKSELQARARLLNLLEYCLPKYLDSRVADPQAFGLTVPCVVGPLARGVARQAVTEAWRRVSHPSNDSCCNHVFLLETPLSLGLILHEQRQWGCHGLVSPGCGRRELSVLLVEEERLSVIAFRELVRGNEAAAVQDLWQRLPVASRPGRWLLALNGEEADRSETPTADLDTLLRSLGCVVEKFDQWSFWAAQAAARFASAQLPGAPRELPTLASVVPRSIGVLTVNSVGSVFWHRLVVAGSAGHQGSFKLRTRSTGQPTIFIASLREGSADNEWLSISNAGDSLHWWQEQVVAAIEPTVPGDRLQLTAVHDHSGFRIQEALIGQAEPRNGGVPDAIRTG